MTGGGARNILPTTKEKSIYTYFCVVGYIYIYIWGTKNRKKVINSYIYTMYTYIFMRA